MKASARTLSQFLATLNLTEQQLKRLTGIPIYRLRIIYKTGQVTDDEFIKLIKVLTARPAAELICASQIGNFNQNGIGNKQTVINNYLTIIMRRLGITHSMPQPLVLPVKPVLAGSVQQRALSQQPGSQVAVVGDILAPVSHSF